MSGLEASDTTPCPTCPTRWRSCVARVVIDGAGIIQSHNDRFASIVDAPGMRFNAHSFVLAVSRRLGCQPLVDLLEQLSEPHSPPTRCIKISDARAAQPTYVSGMREADGSFTLHMVSHNAIVTASQHFQDVMLGTDEPVCVSSLDGRILYANQSLIELLGVADLAWRRLADLVQPADRPQALTTLERLRDDDDAAHLRHRFRRPDGQETWVEWRFLRRPLDGFLCARVVDITEQIRAEQARSIQQRNELVAQVSAGVAHDFKNALAVIRSFAQLIERQAAEGSQTQSDVREILSATGHACDIAEKLVAVGREANYHPEMLVPQRLVRDCLGLIAALAPPSVEVEVDLRCTRRVDVDPASLQRVLYNLAINACDAMPDGGCLTIATRDCRLDAQQHCPLPPGNYVELSVRDEGTGIPVELRESIFRHYFTTKSAHGGTGLGLAVSRGLAEQMGGALLVDSADGVGSCFRLLIPAADTDAASSADESPESSDSFPATTTPT